MGKVDGFLIYERELPELRDPSERVKDYSDVNPGLDSENTKEQAARCMDCGVPFCHKGCPLGNNIPEFNDAVYEGDWELAAELLFETNNFPEFTGRICPAPCEGSCVLGINKPAVAIEHIEKSIVETAFKEGYITPKIPIERSGKSVAVIGSGPAGLAAADQLNQAGHKVKVYEREDRPGGLLRYGIPDFKLEKWVVDRRIQLMEEEGVEFITNTNIGVDVLPDQLLQENDSLVLCGGSTIPRDLSLKGRELEGVHFAMDFLTRQNKKVAGDTVEDPISAAGKNVIVIGGGDTGSDCVGTSNRHGAETITQFELLEKPPFARSNENPWPEWPLILRTSSSHEEGCERQWSILTEEFIGDEHGRLKAVRVSDIEWSASKRDFEKVPGSTRDIPCELVLLAMGFLHPQKQGLLEQLNVELDDRGNVSADQYKSSVDKVFVAGDMRRGQSLVVWAIEEGRRAAAEVDRFLTR